jgi:hypothetical protein
MIFKQMKPEGKKSRDSTAKSTIARNSGSAVVAQAV